MRACRSCLFTEENLPQIQINADGICQVCQVNFQTIQETREQQQAKTLEERWNNIKQQKKGKYDCLIGISGGIDSSFMVLMAKKAGMNPLLLHVDGGWNSTIAVSNIQKLIQWSGFDYEAIVLNWEEIQDAQRAFVKANVLDIDLPFENALLKQLYATAKKHHIQSILFGYNAFTEGLLPEGYTHYKLDKRNIIDIHKRFGRKKIAYSQFIGTLEHFRFTRFSKIRFEYPLNWVEYNKAEAQQAVIEAFNWKDYGGKHHENLYTQFYQEVILPKKFNVYKRIAHLSMLICSGQINKLEAEKELEKEPNISPDAAVYFCKKMELTQEELENYLNTPAVDHRKYKSDLDVYDRYKPVYKKLKNYIGWSWFKGKFSD